MPFKDKGARREYMRKYMREYYKKNKEDMTKSTKAWVDNNRERWREYQREYNREHPWDPEKKKAADARYRERNREEINRRQREYRAHIKAVLGRYKTIKGCCVCGYRKSSWALDFHHTGDDKEYTVARMKGLGIGKIKEELSKCVVVCSNCHRELHAGDVELAQEKEYTLYVQ